MTFSQHQQIFVNRCKEIDKQYQSGKISRKVLKFEIALANCFFNQAVEYSRKGK